MTNYYDKNQEHIVNITNDTALILAGPGCGKTHILAQRVFKAAQHGIDFDAMLCVTFTNRAAREMKQRIQFYLGYEPANLFAGNMHRFCLSFLYENNIIAADTSIIAEEDRNEYIASLLNVYPSARDIQDFLTKAAYVYQLRNHHPEWTLRHPKSEFISDDEMRLIEQYSNFKAQNRLIDFDDILLFALTALLNHPRGSLAMSNYSWVQVDEVQDMTPLQLAIVDMVTRTVDRTLLYFGDEQQAIFNFVGAGGRALEHLKKMCRGNILRLQKNYRSPQRIVDICNRLAIEQLHIDPKLLPQSDNYNDTPDMLTMHIGKKSDSPKIASQICTNWLNDSDGTIAILARTNKDVELISAHLNLANIKHFSVKKQDLFHQLPFRTIWSHLAAVCQPFRMAPWARLLYQTGTVKTLAQARKITCTLRNAGMSFDELFDIDAPSRIEIFAEIMQSDATIVVFDTETTGLDVVNDDIIQIAAVKMRHGKIIKGSEFEVFIESDKRLPELLRNGQPNPLIKIYTHSKHYTPEEGLRAFFEYAGQDAVVAGHNLDFDLSILRNNTQRYLGCNVPSAFNDSGIDTLDVARLLKPHLPNHTLVDMIRALNIDACNTHIATDDARATALLAEKLSQMSIEHLEQIESVREQMRSIAKRFSERYGSFYRYWRKIYKNPNTEVSLLNAVESAANYFAGKAYTEPLQKLESVLKLIDKCIIKANEPEMFRNQVATHLFELLAFNETDLYVNGIIEERVSVMTVHKAKGLEMDNVIVCNPVQNYYNDDARLLYVAFSRARNRLAIILTDSIPNALNNIKNSFRLSVY